MMFFMDNVQYGYDWANTMSTIQNCCLFFYMSGELLFFYIIKFVNATGQSRIRNQRIPGPMALFYTFTNLIKY